MQLPRRLRHDQTAEIVEHLEELRWRIMVALAAVAVATAVAFVFHGNILDWLAKPLPPAHRHVAAFGVTEPFTVSVTVSLYAGILFAVPVTAETRALPQPSQAQLEQPAAQLPTSVKREEHEVV